MLKLKDKMFARDDDEESGPWTLGAGDQRETCPECDRQGIHVSQCNVPAVGPVEIPGFEVCEARGHAYYHPEDQPDVD